MEIKDWKKFQHFRDRRPPWIKLYRTILDDPQWFALSPIASRVLVMLWLVASEDEGRLPDLDTISFRFRMPKEKLSSAIQELGHFLIQDDITVISRRYQDDTPERERERETERETDLCVRSDFDRFWQAYPRKVGKHAAQKAFRNAQNRPAIELLLAAIGKAKDSQQWTKEGGQFIPHPATWLNQGRWADEPVQAPKSVFQDFLERG